MDPRLHFDPELLSRHDLVGPRYTSYPTAPNFSPAFDAAQYRHHARTSNEDPIPQPLSLYVHLPFCASPCFYCGCNRVITRDRRRADDYLDRLVREVALQGALFDRDRPVRQLHLGGGTPNFLDAAQLGRLMSALDSHFTLEHDDGREYGIEIDPRCVTPAEMPGLAALGFNRASFGIQDFDPAVQAAVNRIQGEAETRAVIEAARAAGFRSINVDLIYGLPKQNAEGFARTLDAVVALRPDRIALYSYAHLPELFRAQQRIRPEDLPTPAAKLGLLGQAIARLDEAGFRYIGMDHFARPEDELARALERGGLQRNFQGYSTHAGLDLVGIGVSAIGAVGDCYAQNARDLGGYYALLDAGTLPVARGHALSADDRRRASVIQALMCAGELDIPAWEAQYGVPFAASFGPELARLRELARDGLVEVGGTRIAITPRGRLLVRLAAMAFDAWLQRPREQPARFSRVI